MKSVQCITQALVIMLFFFLLATSQVLAGGINYFSDVSVEIISDERGFLTKHAAGFGNNHAQRSYVVARDDERYRIRVRNRSNARIGLVITVDGRNIISGSKSYLRSQERMYILGPYETAEYEGWRTGRNRVNRFYFKGMSDSYAASWGDYSAMGVIAVAAYKSHHRNMFRYKDEQKKRPLDRPGANSRGQDPGTGFGETEWSPSITVQFTPHDMPVAKEFIKYEWRSTLCKRGVVRCRNKRMRNNRNRFWPDPSHDDGFAPFPGLAPWPLR